MRFAWGEHPFSISELWAIPSGDWLAFSRLNATLPLSAAFRRAPRFA